MHLTETPEQDQLRQELRSYFAQLLTPQVRDSVGESGEGSQTFRRIVRQMGKDGWLGLGWPTEYGGRGRPPTDQFILFDEVQRAHAPFPFVTINTVGPTLIAYGTEEQKAAYLPGILAGELNFAIGYTEPESGTDLASLRTSAVLDGDEWVINGNKVYTSGANQADYVWLACRTDPEAAKHKGISIIIVPTNVPGFSWTPIVTVGGNVTTATYYSDVRVPKGNVVSEINRGWQLITTQLNHERVGLAALTGSDTSPLRRRRFVGGSRAFRRSDQQAHDRSAVGPGRFRSLQGNSRSTATDELEIGALGQRWHPDRRRRRRRSRCSAPNVRSRSTSCCLASSDH